MNRPHLAVLQPPNGPRLAAGCPKATKCERMSHLAALQPPSPTPLTFGSQRPPSARGCRTWLPRGSRVREGLHVAAPRPPNATPSTVGDPKATKNERGRIWRPFKCLQSSSYSLNLHFLSKIEEFEEILKNTKDNQMRLSRIWLRSSFDVTYLGSPSQIGSAGWARRSCFCVLS